MTKLTAIRVIATLGMLVFIGGGLAVVLEPEANPWPATVGGFVMVIFGLWAGRIAREDGNG